MKKKIVSFWVRKNSILTEICTYRIVFACIIYISPAWDKLTCIYTHIPQSSSADLCAFVYFLLLLEKTNEKKKKNLTMKPRSDDLYVTTTKVWRERKSLYKLGRRIWAFGILTSDGMRVSRVFLSLYTWYVMLLALLTAWNLRFFFSFACTTTRTTRFTRVICIEFFSCLYNADSIAPSLIKTLLFFFYSSLVI